MIFKFKYIYYSLSLALLMTGSTFLLFQNVSASFPDVNENTPYNTAIEYAQKNNIVKGYTDGTFKSSKTISRGEFTKIIVSATVTEDEIFGINCFSDVRDKWFSEYICTAQRKGIIKGYSDGYFRPNNEISFIEAAKIISLAFGNDVTESKDIWYKSFVENLASQKSIPPSITKLNKRINRGEMVEMIWRIKEKIQTKGSMAYFNNTLIETGFFITPTSTSSLPPVPPTSNPDSNQESKSDRDSNNDGNGSSTTDPSPSPTPIPIPEYIKLIEAENLPMIPDDTLHSTQKRVSEGVKYHTIKPDIPNSANYDYTSCDVSDFWDDGTVSVGGRANGNNEDVCKVQAQTDDGGLRFLTKWPINNIHYPLTPDAAWASFRFPIPKDHIATKLEYEISWYKLFGSKPTNCHKDDIDSSTGECILDVSSDWNANVPAGLFLLWAKPGDSQHFITGPHSPIEQIGYSRKKIFSAEIPESYQNQEEIIITLLTYNQYTKACEADNSSSCTNHTNEDLEVHSVSLKTEEPFNTTKMPSYSHPRILGNNQELTEYFRPFTDLECVENENNTDAEWGEVFNIKNIWDKNVLGYRPCIGESPNSITNVKDAEYYLDSGNTDKWDYKRALRILFLLRNEKFCHETSSTNSCSYSESDISDLQEAFISSELRRFPSVEWSSGYKCFDIGTEPKIKFWSIFTDVFWNDLNENKKTEIDEQLKSLTDCYLDQIKERDWSIYNGNNWTAILAKGAVYWAITYYYEEDTAPEVLEKALESLWLHRDFYLEDGAYIEGIVEYTNVSYSNLREINNLMLQSFGESISSVDWENTKKTSRWYLDFMGPDGHMADFGDSWGKRGWSTLDPLHMMLWQEMTGEKNIGRVNLDSCQVREYFSNKWFYHGTYDPWSMQPSMARDWKAIADECDIEQKTGTFVNLFEEIHSGTLRTYLPGSTETARNNGLRFEQADQTWLAMSGIPNDFPHRELDFGGLVWSAYGNRLLADFGYGQIGKMAKGQPYLIEGDGLLLFDNIALGANTLVVEDATQSGYNGGKYNNATINSSQIYEERGDSKKVRFGSFSGIHLDARGVYGRNDSELGWLRYFDRWFLSLNDGNYLVLDAFAVKEDLGTADVQEYWHVQSEQESISSCSYSYKNVDLTLESSKSIRLKPQCSSLERNADSTVEGRITAASLKPGEFSIDPEVIEYPTRLSSVTNHFKRARFRPLSPVSEDIRVFVLQSAPDIDELKDIRVEKVSCSDNSSENICFEVETETLENHIVTIEFSRSGDKYVLESVL